ncbi:hypothetical protein [Bosea sp. 685]|uniref:hypothetical protein n=1 Tax=Bosea sp. 685 TaxID=3080057 RepID=UPI00289379CE|nr:hypothetical protein [Bosea sp. 685]WNJ91107.1 hypothetical protein RMR04_02025 [Bosea sp. 685]
MDDEGAISEIKRRADRLQKLAAEAFDWPSKEAANRMLGECRAFERGLPQKFGNVTSQITYLMEAFRMMTKASFSISDARNAARTAFARIDNALGIHERAKS